MFICVCVRVSIQRLIATLSHKYLRVKTNLHIPNTCISVCRWVGVGAYVCVHTYICMYSEVLPYLYICKHWAIVYRGSSDNDIFLPFFNF